jgi:hypothetical protein
VIEPTPPRSPWKILGSALLAVILIAGLLLLSLGSLFQKGNNSSPPLPEKMAARIQAIEREAVAIRGLRPKRPVKVHLLAARAFTTLITHVFSSSNTPGQLRIGDIEGVLSGAFPPGTNLAKVVNSGLPSQVAGWYDFHTKQLYVRDSGQALGIDRWALAHEYTHAMQDQYFNLAKVQPDQTHWKIRNSDAQLAEHSLVEGDAVEVQNQFLADYYSQAEMRALFRSQQSSGGSQVPRTIEEGFNFPYTDGPSYVQYLLTRGGYTAVNHAFRHPPQTTFQLMFPGRAIRVTRVHLTRVLGPFRTWRIVDDDVNGAFGYQQLVELQLPLTQASRLALLWRGDRYVLLRKGPRYAMLLESVYADRNAAQTAEQIVGSALARRFGGLLPTVAGGWTGNGHIDAAIALRGRRLFLAFGHSPKTVKRLVVAPTR